jgi:GNAT superfamily N-acetyltransferase
MISIKTMRLSKEDALTIARIHREGITKGFLPRLGDRFLRQLYIAISYNIYSRVFVAVEEETSIVGFLAGSVNTNKMYRSILARHGLFFFFLLLPKIFSGAVMAKILETLLYPFRNKSNHARTEDFPKANLCEGKNAEEVCLCAELLVIAVAKEARKKGCGRKLVIAFEQFLKEKKLPGYHVVTFSKDAPANRFYESCGFKLQATFIHHDNILNRYRKYFDGMDGQV